MDNEKTLLEVIEECADRIRLKILTDDSDEMVSIHISKKMNLIHLNNEDCDYGRLKDDWQKL